MNKRHYEHTLPNIRGSLSNTYVVLVEEVLPEVGEEIPEAVHADELPLVLFAGLERLQLTVCRDALDAFRLLFLLVVSHQVTLFLSGVFAALSSGIYFLHDC